MNKHSKGGKTTAIINRNNALCQYYLNPNYCKQCNNIIQVKENEKVSIVKRKKFCSKKCSAIYNNSQFPKRKKEYKYCKQCNNTFIPNGKEQFCQDCKSKPDERYDYTLQEIKQFKKNRLTYHSYIRSRARNITRNRIQKCIVCGYNKHVETCHIKPVRDFDENSKLSVVNSQENLILLCPNHHWEFDNNILNIAGLSSQV